MATFSIVNRSPDGSTYFAEEGMGNWTFGTIVEIDSNGFNGSFVEADYLTIQMSAVPGFPQLFFRVYGHFNIQYDYNSDGVLVPYVQAGSIINQIDVIDQTGKVYSSLSGISFPVNSDKTSFGYEQVNIFANSFRPGETPDVATLMNGNDAVNGNSGTEFLYGYNGNDSLYGGGSGDALFGGNGHDQLFGGLGSDDLYGGAGNDTIFGYDGTDYIDAGADFDTWQITGTYTTGISIPPVHNLTSVTFYGIEAIRIVYGEIVLNSAQVGGASLVQTVIGGSAYRDSLRVMALDNMAVNLDGVTFVDWNNWSGEFDRLTIYGFSGNDTITGSRVNDMIYTLDGNNWVRGNLGDDVISAADGNDTIWGDQGTDRITGWGGNDILHGGSNSTTPTADGDDWLYGGLGNDILRSGQGFNVVDGGDGIDTIDYRFPVQTTYPGETVTIVTQIDLSRAVNPDDPNSPYSAYVDTVFSDISIPVARDVIVNVENVEGSDRADHITGNGVANRLRGWGGNDTLRGLDGVDALLGGTGDDNIEGGLGNDVLAGEAGNDRLDGGDGIDSVAFVDVVAITVNLALTTAQNTGQGLDVLLGIENLATGSGADRLTGNALANTISSGLGNDLIGGAGGNDNLLGSSGLDTLQGGAGHDTLTGGADNDFLNGGGGNDSLIGGAGTDNFVFDIGYGSDRIRDFQNGIDKLRIVSGADTFAQVTVTDAGANAVITFGGVTVTLENFVHTSVDASDFVFL